MDKTALIVGAGSGLSTVASAHRSGFETKIALKRSYSSYELQAIDAGGHVIGTSKGFT